MDRSFETRKDVEEKLLHDLIYSNTYKTLQCFLNRLDFLITNEIGTERTDALFDVLIDKDFLKEVKDFCHSSVSLHFGKTLKELKCVITDENLREHAIWIRYIGAKNLRITNMDLPQSHIENQIYRSLEDIVKMFQKHVLELSNYFDELTQIDRNCTVIEPVRPTFKENYRKVQLADKIWLHIKLSPDGSAKNLSVLGQFDQQVLQELLQAWDHDKNIATNVLKIVSCLDHGMHPEMNQTVRVPDCGICYCVELPGDTTVPQPLCSNSKCGAYFHRSCLYEWFVMSAGGRTPQFGFGKCPCCSQFIQCSDRDM